MLTTSAAGDAIAADRRSQRRSGSGNLCAVIRDVEVRDAGSKGRGVFALRDFDQGEFIFRRRHGQVVQNSRIASLSADDQRHLCELDWTKSAVLLPPGCYLNHACDPNAMRGGVRVFAWRPIVADEEITIDYRLNSFGDSERWRCDCGAKNCSGAVVCSFFALPAETQRLYLPHAPVFIRREYQRRRSAT
jgi:SET domain-containing protein